MNGIKSLSILIVLGFLSCEGQKRTEINTLEGPSLDISFYKEFNLGYGVNFYMFTNVGIESVNLDVLYMDSAFYQVSKNVSPFYGQPSESTLIYGVLMDWQKLDQFFVSKPELTVNDSLQVIGEIIDLNYKSSRDTIYIKMQEFQFND